jgi:hypothetical protein
MLTSLLLGLTDVGHDGRIEGTTIELIYPWRFLHRLCGTALEQLGPYYDQNEINPYDSFDFGTYWIRELNR